MNAARVVPARVSTARSMFFVSGPTLICANLEPYYRLADQAPDREQAVDSSHRLDAKLDGSNPIDGLIEFHAPLYAHETLETIAEVHATMKRSAESSTCGRLERCGAGSPKTSIRQT